MRVYFNKFYTSNKSLSVIKYNYEHYTNSSFSKTRGENEVRVILAKH
jgi:hypothetical protein